MQTILGKYAFSNFSKRNLVPKLLTHGRFTTKGFQMLGTNDPKSRNFVERKLKKIQRPVDLTDVKDAHLYYDHSAYLKKKYQHWRSLRDVVSNQRCQTRMAMFQNAPSLDHVFQLIKDPINLETGSWKLLFGLKLLHKHYSEHIPENGDQILYALERINKFVWQLDIYNFRSLISFATRYLNHDQDIWKAYLGNTIRFILSHEQQQRPLLSPDVADHIREEFITIFHTVVERTLHFKHDLVPLITQLDLMMRNHYRDIKYLRDPPKPNSFSTLQGDSAAFFFSDFARVIVTRKDFYNDFDTSTKQRQTREILQDGSKTLIATKSLMTARGKQSVKLAIAAIQGTKYEFEGLPELKQEICV